MDQMKTLIPYSRFNFSKLSNLHRLKVHVMGALVFGRQLSCFLDILEYKHDTNLNINVILSMLYRERERLPKKFHLQLDNTASQNKNQILLAFLAYLVERCVFDEVTVGFLMKGHTHTQLDQFFSRLSTHIAKLPRGVLTYKQLEDAIRSCYNNEKNLSISTAYPERTKTVYNFRDFLEPFSRGLAGLHSYHGFRLSRLESGKAFLQVKRWADDPWKESNKPIELLKSFPTGEPELILPDYSKVKLNKLTEMVEIANSVGVFEPQEYKEWTEEFLPTEELKSAKSSDCATSVVSMIDEILGSQRRATEHETSNNTETLSVPLVRAKDQATGIAPEVTTRDGAFTTVSATVSDDAIQAPYEELKRGKLVLLKPKVFNCIDWHMTDGENYNPVEVPWIGKVLSRPDPETGLFPMQWMKGTLNGEWKPWQEGKKKFTETQHVNSVVSCGFELSVKKQLSEHMAKFIETEFRMDQSEYLLGLGDDGSDSDDE